MFTPPTPSVSTTRKHLVKAATLLAIAAGTSALTGGVAQADPSSNAPLQVLTASPATVDFGHVLAGENSVIAVHLVNTAGQPIRSLFQVSITPGPGVGDVFVNEGYDCHLGADEYVPVNGECDIFIGFNPTKAAGARAAVSVLTQGIDASGRQFVSNTLDVRGIGDAFRV